MVGLESLAVGVTEGYREFFAWMREVVTEGLGGEVKAAVSDYISCSFLELVRVMGEPTVSDKPQEPF